MAVGYVLFIAAQLIKALCDLVDNNTFELLYSIAFKEYKHDPLATQSLFLIVKRASHGPLL